MSAAGSSKSAALIAGVAGLVAGAMSMAAGEFVSVSSQADTESADLAKEAEELATDPVRETEELARIYVDRGLNLPLAREVAQQLMSKDALGAHARDELGISEAMTARPGQAAGASAIAFSLGAAAPLIVTSAAPSAMLVPIVAVGSLVCLAALGVVGAKTGGAGVLRPTIRVTFWGAVAMSVTTGVGALIERFI